MRYYSEGVIEKTIGNVLFHVYFFSNKDNIEMTMEIINELRKVEKPKNQINIIGVENE